MKLLFCADIILVLRGYWILKLNVCYWKTPQIVELVIQFFVTKLFLIEIFTFILLM